MSDTPLKPTIEALLDMSLERLCAMGEVELQTYLEEAIKVCPPIRGRVNTGVRSSDGTVLGSFRGPKGNKFAPSSALGQSLSPTNKMTAKEKILLELAKAGMTEDDIKK